jgi:hypothetical protein
MTAENKRKNGVADPDVFTRFGRSFRGSSAWRPYFVRWERQAEVRFDHRWILRAELEVPSAGRAFVRLFWSSRSRRPASPEGEPGFERLRSDLEGCGYELRAPGSPYWLLLKRFRPTGSLLADVRREVEARFWPGEPTPPATKPSKGGIAGALHQFTRTPAWRPSSCGWSWRFKLRDRTEVALVMLVVQGDRGSRLRPEPMVLLYPPQSAGRERLRRLGALCRGAGYEGKFETARPTGRKPFLFAHYQKKPIRFDRVEAERARLDELARALRLLR